MRSLSRFKISLTTYFASATVIGLAVGFGLQGFVQDLVIGFTLIFSDALNIGEVVKLGDENEISQAIQAIAKGMYNQHRSILLGALETFWDQGCQSGPMEISAHQIQRKCGPGPQKVLHGLCSLDDYGNIQGRIDLKDFKLFTYRKPLK